MLGHRAANGHQAQIAGHAQMADQAATTDIHQQVLGPAADLAEGLVFNLDCQVLGDRPAQTAVAHNQPGDLAAFQMRSDAAAGGFYFWQFGHLAACVNVMRRDMLEVMRWGLLGIVYCGLCVGGRELCVRAC